MREPSRFHGRNFKIALKGFFRDQGKTQKGNRGYLISLQAFQTSSFEGNGV